MKVVVSAILLFVLNGLVFGQDDLVVEKSVGPKTYPPAARAVRARGIVSVQVTIDSKGKVIEATAFSGHPLLKAISVATAKEWEFSKVLTKDENEPRTSVIFFNFTLDGIKRIDSSEKREEEMMDNVFTSAFSLDATWVTVIPRILSLPRKDGKLPTKVCPLHESEMHAENLKPLCTGNYGTIRNTESTVSITDVEGELFPNANSEVYTSCGEHAIEQIEVQYCSYCRIRREQWIRDNPK